MLAIRSSLLYVLYMYLLYQVLIYLKTLESYKVWIEDQDLDPPYKRNMVHQCSNIEHRSTVVLLQNCILVGKR